MCIPKSKHPQPCVTAHLENGSCTHTIQNVNIPEFHILQFFWNKGMKHYHFAKNFVVLQTRNVFMFVTNKWLVIYWWLLAFTRIQRNRINYKQDIHKNMQLSPHIIQYYPLFNRQTVCTMFEPYSESFTFQNMARFKHLRMWFVVPEYSYSESCACM